MFRKKYLVIALVLAVLFAVIGNYWALFAESSEKLYSIVKKYAKVVSLISKQYVEDVDLTELFDGAVEGMVSKLDPHSDYFEEEVLEQFEEEQRGSFGGIGVEITEKDGYIYVVSPMEGTPAWEAGFQQGDLIIAVDSISTKDETLHESIKRIKGEIGTEVRLSVLRGEKVWDYTLKRAKIPIYSIPYAFHYQEDVGYIRITRFANTTFNEFQEALQKLDARNMRQLVVDLRGNPGGSLDQVVRMAGLFIPRGEIVVYTEGRYGSNHRDLRSYGEDLYDTPLIILVDKNSASASEIFSGSLQDYDRAVVVGENTFGKGLVQQLFPIRENTKLKLTVAKYYTPSGRCIQRDWHDLSEDEYRKGRGNGDVADSLVFYTLLEKREVYGGGGIMPDVLVTPDSLTDLELDFYRSNAEDRLLFNFVTGQKDRWLSLPEQYPNPLDFELTEDIENSFIDTLRAHDLEWDEETFAEAWPRLRNLLKRDFVHYLWPDAADGLSAKEAAVAIGLQNDKVFLEALLHNEEAKRLADLHAKH